VNFFLSLLRVSMAVTDRKDGMLIATSLDKEKNNAGNKKE
jgi:hypothetical protein